MFPGRSRVVAIYRPLLDRMSDAVLRWPATETGGVMLGVIDGQQNVLITEVLIPDLDIRRLTAGLTVGGQFLASIVSWKRKNFLQKVKPSTPFFADGRSYEVVGYWHSHHQLRVNSLSMTDVDSMQKHIKNGLSVQIWPLATIPEYQHHQLAQRVVPMTEKVTLVHDKSLVEWRFFGMWRDDPRLIQTQAMIMSERAFNPVQIPLSWKFVRNAEYTAQMEALTKFGCTINEVEKNLPDQKWLVHLFVLSKPSWGDSMVNILTPWNYPDKPPVVQIITDGKINPISLDLPNGDKLWRPGDGLNTIIMGMEARGML